MLGSTILEVAIGLIFVYWLLAMICSALNEYIANTFAARAKNLEEAVYKLLGDGVAPAGARSTTNKLVEDFFAHPLIKGMSGSQGLAKLKQEVIRPNYIPADVFARTILDLLVPATGEPQTFAEVRGAILALENEDLKRVLLMQLDATSQDLKQTRANIESWFNDAMERASGWYKRRVQIITIVVAVLLVALLNVDSFVLTKQLSQDATLRASVVAAAEKTTNTPDSSAASEPLTRVTALRKELEQLDLPVGWIIPCHIAGICDIPESESEVHRLPTELSGWLTKLFGLAFTALAVSLGAPFWFDVLNKFINVRATGKPPAADEPAKPAGK